MRFHPGALFAASGWKAPDFTGVNFAGTALSGVDLTACRLEGLTVSQARRNWRARQYPRSRPWGCVRCSGWW